MREKAISANESILGILCFPSKVYVLSMLHGQSTHTDACMQENGSAHMGGKKKKPGEVFLFFFSC